VPYSVLLTPRFKREARRLVKKYPSLRGELESLGKELSNDPELGISLGFGLFKIRLAIQSKGKGKSGGARVITYFIDRDKTVYLLTVYDKSEVSNISTEILRQYARELLSQQPPPR
jgi:mRNA-degrading endonuclease RelE of RelBE toxin-antitoxin system